jgi:hypothetical protein
MLIPNACLLITKQSVTQHNAQEGDGAETGAFRDGTPVAGMVTTPSHKFG